MSKGDYIPSRDEDFLIWVKNLFDYANVHEADWLINPDAWTQFDKQIKAYEAALKKAQEPNRGSADVLVKNETRDALKKTVRQLVKEYLEYNHLITDEDREHMRLPIHDTTHTRRPRPGSRTALTGQPTNNRQHTLSALDQKTGKKTKPNDAYGVKYAWEIRETLPESPDDLRHSLFSRKTVHVFDYEEKDRGKKVFYAARYENAKGEGGPWSDIIDLLIP